MITPETINRIIQLGEHQMETTNAELAEFKTQAPMLVVPDGLNLVDLEKHMPQRTRLRGRLHTNSLVDFRDYAEKYDLGDEKSVCFVDGENLTAKVIFDRGNEDQPLHCEHSAVVTLERTPEFTAALQINEESLLQRHFANWIEEWRDMLTFASDIDMDNEITVAAAVSAIRSMDFTKTQDRGHVAMDHSSSQSVLEKEELKNADRFPTFMRVLCQPTDDLQPREIIFRISTMTGERPAIFPKIMRWGSLRRDIADEFSAMVEGELDANTDILVFNGKLD